MVWYNNIWPNIFTIYIWSLISCFITIVIFHYLYHVTLLQPCFIVMFAWHRYMLHYTFVANHYTALNFCTLHLHLTNITHHAIHHHSLHFVPQSSVTIFNILDVASLHCTVVIVGYGAIGPTFRHVRPPSRIFSHFVCEPLLHDIITHMTFSSYYTSTRGGLKKPF